MLSTTTRLGIFTLTDHRLDKAVDHLLRLIDCASPSGAEEPAVAEAERICREIGLPSRRMPVGDGRDNLIAGSTRPRLLFCAHLDTVPPHRPGRLSDGQVWGRGAVSGKGPAVAMLHALDLVREHAAEVGCALVVGEEADHAGAKALTRSEMRPEHIILGDATGSPHPAKGQKGLLKLRLVARGVSGHSAYPEAGVSAVHRLLDALGAIEKTPLPADPLLGDTTVNVGQISGGVAPNVIAPSAEATLVVRCAAPVDCVLPEIAARVGDGVLIEELHRAEPLDFFTPDRASGAVPFNTDAATLLPLGARMVLFGPGDMRRAHCDSEALAIEELGQAIESYATLALRLL